MKLNAIQEVMANHHEGPAAFFATAGSGKTTGVAENISRKLQSGIDPRCILATTFNKDACAELKSRVKRLFGGVADMVGIRTSHSLCFEIVRRYHNVRRDEFLVNEYAAKKLIKDKIRAQRIYKYQQGDENDVMGAIGLLKNHLCWYEAVDSLPFKENLNEVLPWVVGRVAIPEEIILACWKQYEEYKVNSATIDHDDMLFRAYWILMTNPDALSFYQKQFNYLIVDEYQDTNEAQYQIFKLLAAEHRNLMVVGDDDQSIYAFRGSYPRYIREFLKDYPDCVHVALDQNYRCQSGIVDAANTLIQVNGERYPKDIKAAREFVRKPIYVTCADERSEAKFIAESIGYTEYKYGDIAILTRLNAQQCWIEEALIEKEIPYFIVDGTTFFKRREIDACLKYLQLAAGGCEDMNLIQELANKPYRKIPNGEINNWRHTNDMHRMPMAYGYLQQLDVLESTFRENKGCMGTVLDVVINYPCNLHYWVKNDGKLSADNKAIQNLEAFMQMCKGLSYEELMAKVAKASTEQVKEVRKKENKVAISTIHKSKGLEWSEVYIPGCNQGILPHKHCEDIEEERRLKYVAITRARDLLFMTGHRDKDISQFVEEMGDAIDYDEVLEETHA
jgi:DNA helicase-2/ATP-dependent DNA helicase PcrA